ncbi:NUDIX hydrolase [Hoyosella rhizosphaerae]|nr:NUDIX hydrolase [Hoyosella rhizosphaerae]
MLIRDASKRLEVFLQCRTATMPFAPGMTVFPGGSVDSDDYRADVAWHGPSTEDFAQLLGTTSDLARALVCAAVRETFEECGVLLATSHDGSPIEKRWFDDHMHRARSDLADRSISLADLLNRHRFILRADLLAPVSTWITPIGNARRYNTRFFLAALPEGQEADGHTTEADRCYWCAPSTALEEWTDGKTILLPPTWTQIRTLAGYSALADLPIPFDTTTNEPIPVIESAPMNDATGWRLGFPHCEEYFEGLPEGAKRGLRP